MIEVTYEVYRFKKWWKTTEEKLMFNNKQEFIANTRDPSLICKLERDAKKENMGEIRNLKYKFIEDEK